MKFLLNGNAFDNSVEFLQVWVGVCGQEAEENFSLLYKN